MNNTTVDELSLLSAFLTTCVISVQIDEVLLNAIYSFDAKGLPTGELTVCKGEQKATGIYLL